MQVRTSMVVVAAAAAAAAVVVVVVVVGSYLFKHQHLRHVRKR